MLLIFLLRGSFFSLTSVRLPVDEAVADADDELEDRELGFEA